MTTHSAGDRGKPVVSILEAKRFVRECFIAVNVPLEYAELCADVLIEADCRGHFSHGMNILEKYLASIRKNHVDVENSPVIEKENEVTALVNGHNAMGPVVGDFCMKLAIEKAKISGIGWVVVHGSNNYGIAGYYSQYAIKHDLIGWSFSNGSPYVCPTRAKETALGSNPLSMAAPGTRGDYFNLDMATSLTSGGKVEILRKDRLPIPEGWVFTPDGKIETDCDKAVQNLLLAPLGCEEVTSGYKGTSLSLMVEIFCGILSGSLYAHHIRKWGKNSNGPADIGHCFVAINPAFFNPYFQDCMDDYLFTFRRNDPMVHELPVIAPGDKARMCHRKARQRGLIYSQQQLNTCTFIASKYNVEPLLSEIL